MSTKRTSTIVLLLIAAFLISACQQATAPQEANVRYDAVSEPEAPPADFDKSIAGEAAAPGQLNTPARVDSLIIKTGDFTLLVDNVGSSIERVTAVATETGGFVVSSNVWTQGNSDYATITIRLPVAQFEAAQSRLRGLAVDVLSESSSGQDVSEEYVDLESRLRNLEATATRIRAFLDEAKNVEEALDVNARLTEVESEIEQIKGRMSYLEDRAAFSTITVQLQQDAAPIEPQRWTPGKTAEAAVNSLGNLLQGLADLGIWLAIAVAPVALPVVAITFLVLRARRRNRSVASS